MRNTWQRLKKRIFTISCLLIGLCTMSAGSVSASEAAQVKSINHRGYCKVAPENTLPAYVLSKEMGYTYVEADISFTMDGVPVLLHDARINRTARNEDGSHLKKRIFIKDITYEEALSYDFGIWKGQEYKGTKLPTFDEFLQLCKKLRLHPYIELKENGDYTREQIVQLVDMVREKDMEKQVTWISFNDSYLSWVRNYDSQARLGFLEQFLFSVDDFEKTIIIAKNLQTEFNEVFLDVNYIPLLYDDLATDIFINMCWEAGLPLEVWTVDRKDVIRSLNPYISGVTSNRLIYEDVIKETEKDSE